MSEAMLKRWFVRQGFRGDGDRCAWRRWLADWMDAGLATSFIQEDGTRGIWWTEIGPENYARITRDAEKLDIGHFYQGDGNLFLPTARRLGVTP